MGRLLIGMNRPFTALLALIDATLSVAIGIAVLLAPLTLLWLTQFQVSVDYAVFARIAANFWLMGNAVDVGVTLDPMLAARFGLAGAGTPFVLGLAPLGIALITFFLGRRLGLRLAGTPFRPLGALVGILTVAALSGVVAAAASTDVARPQGVQALFFPALIFAAGLATSLYSRTRGTSGVPLPAVIGRVEGWVLDALSSVSADARALLALALRGGAAAAAGIVGIAGVLTTLMIFGHYAQVIALYESLQTEIVGGIALTVGQLTLVPNLVVWAASYLIGPGFAVGAGSAVSPLGTQLGLVPALPMFGALPQSSASAGLVVLLVPVVVGLVVGLASARRLVDVSGDRPGGILRLVVTGLGIAVFGATILAALAALSAGGMGPGRLGEVGPNAALIWVYAAGEIAIGACVGLLLRSRRLAVESPDPLPGESANEPVLGDSNKL